MRLVAREGLEGLTMRAVANEADLSYGSLFHYFDSKDQLLMFAVHHSTEQQGRRVSEFSARHKGLKALERLLCDDAITDESSCDEWMVWQAFLYRAALKDSFAKMHAGLIEGWVARIRALLEEALALGEVEPGLDTEVEAMAIWVYSAGVGQQGLLHPAMFPAATQRKLISLYLDKLGPVATD